ncbi:MAG: DUF4376 domain-containing protein [Alphaproteobacteria bacterium]|nr:MAG: DUF4376 domain-containing protein [Alphaproteobacteria bacterium]
MEQHNKVTFAGKIFASDDTAATRLLAAITARSIAQTAGLEATNATAKWEAMDGTMVPMTLNEQRQLLLAGVARTQACFDQQAALLANGAAAANQAALDSINITLGWPA